MLYHMVFKNTYLNKDLICTYVTDQFTTTNSKAKLEYPVGLITSSEIDLLNNDNSRKTGYAYLLGSPQLFSYLITSSSRILTVNSVGTIKASGVHNTYGARPAVSLLAGTVFTSGDGSMNNPYVVEVEDATF